MRRSFENIKPKKISKFIELQLYTFLTKIRHLSAPFPSNCIIFIGVNCRSIAPCTSTSTQTLHYLESFLLLNNIEFVVYTLYGYITERSSGEILSMYKNGKYIQVEIK